MTNEYGSKFFNDHEDEFFYNKKINLCSQQPYQNQVTTPPTSPFLYASYEPSSLSCDTSLSSCSSSSLSPILTPTTTISPSHSTLNSVPSSLSASPIKSKFLENDINENDNNSSSSLSQESLYEDYELYNNTHDNALNTTPFHHNIIEQSQQQLQQYYNKEQLRILSLIENQRQQYSKHKEFNDEQYKIDPEFVNSNSNLFKWTFIKPKFPILFDQMYDKANGCFFLAGIPVEFIFDLYKYTEDNFMNEDINEEH